MQNTKAGADQPPLPGATPLDMVIVRGGNAVLEIQALADELQITAPVASMCLSIIANQAAGELLALIESWTS